MLIYTVRFDSRYSLPDVHTPNRNVDALANREPAHNGGTQRDFGEVHRDRA